MRYKRTPTFKRDLEKLPDEIQKATKESFKLFQEQPYYPYHPSLRIKRMQGYPNIWEGHVTRDYVFTFHRENDPETNDIVIVFRRIGKHSIYKKP